MITYVRGDILQADAEVILIPVNCVGAMGAGLAIACANRFPEVEEQYKEAVAEHRLRPGFPVLTYSNSGKAFCMFPTKKHWKEKSEYIWIADGLDALLFFNLPSVAIPPLGCGLGGLNWDTVHAIILAALEKWPSTDFQIYPPKGSQEWKAI